MVQECPQAGASKAGADGVGTERVALGQEEAVWAEGGCSGAWALRTL